MALQRRNAAILEQLESRLMMATDLSASILPYTTPIEVTPGDLKLGVIKKVTVLVPNSGDTLAYGLMTIKLYASDDQTLDGEDTLLATSDVAVKINPLKIKKYKFSKITAPELTPGAYYLIADVDTNNTIVETNDNNNVAVSTQTVLWHERAVIVVPPTSGTWSTSVVDSTGDVGMFTSIATGTDGTVHVTYVDDTNETVKYAKWNGTSWTTQVIGDASGPWGMLTGAGRSAIALDANNNPHVIYVQRDVGHFYTKWNGSAWTSAVAVPFNGSWTMASDAVSIAVDSNGTAHVALGNWHNILGTELVYWNSATPGTATVVDVVDSGNSRCSIALDSTGKPRISYEAKVDGTQKLKYAEWNGATWDITTIATSWGYSESYQTSLAIDSSNNPHIGFYVGGAYKYAYRSAGVWAVSTIETYSSVGLDNISLSLDSSGRPYVAFLAGYYRLRYGYKSGSSWTLTTLDANYGADCDIAVASSGAIYISYLDDTNWDLKIAKKT